MKLIDYMTKTREAHKKALSIARTGMPINIPKVECPKCHMVGALNLMKRYHFDRCTK